MYSTYQWWQYKYSHGGVSLNRLSGIYSNRLAFQKQKAYVTIMSQPLKTNPVQYFKYF